MNKPGSDTERALGMLAAEQAALRRVATLVASAAAPDQVFHAVAQEAGRLLGAKTAATVRFAEQGGVVVDGDAANAEASAGRVVMSTDARVVAAEVHDNGRGGATLGPDRDCEAWPTV